MLAQFPQIATFYTQQNRNISGQNNLSTFLFTTQINNLEQMTEWLTDCTRALAQFESE